MSSIAACGTSAPNARSASASASQIRRHHPCRVWGDQSVIISDDAYRSASGEA